VAYGLRVRGGASTAIHTRVDHALSVVGLETKRRQNALTLSSGEVQRLGLARALVIKPEILYLDEPTAFIDAQNRLIIEDVLQGLKREGRTIIVMATHDRDQAERLADQILILRDGAID